MFFYRNAVRPILFRMGRGDPEAAHERTLALLEKWGDSALLRPLLGGLSPVKDPRRVFGLDFPNAVGLAAGMDKDGVALSAWPAMGFGFVEVGTVTWQGQPGNRRPRLYRLPASEALINRMGFNNDGARALAARLRDRPRTPVPLGVSLGKSKVTPLEHAVQDYLASFAALYAHGDYFAVNVSSPNTPGLRSLQDAEHLETLLRAMYEEGVRLSRGARPKPILVKIAPDLTESAIAQALEVCLANGVSGVIAVNTTLGRDGVALADDERAAQAGGLSGAPLREIAVDVVKFVHRETGGRLPVIGVGGIIRPEHAGRLIDAGASLVQLYTGLVYSGPSLVRKAAKAAGRHFYGRGGTPPPRPYPQGGARRG
ncbi:MAG: quinone-dependent dihydroorotate dehydrogenase [Stackebrandtia sp.]